MEILYHKPERKCARRKNPGRRRRRARFGIILRMITMIISFALSGGAFSAAYFAADWGAGWSIACAILAFLAFQIVFGMKMRKKIMADMMRVQEIMLEGQKALQAKMQRWQIRPPGSIQAAQREIEQDTRAFVMKAIEETDRLKRYRLWVPLIDRQMATAKAQFYWMIKDFAKFDEFIPMALMADPVMYAMRMARMHMLGRPVEEIGKIYAKSARRARYNANVVPAACWSWILVKAGRTDDAFKALGEALKRSDDETLKRNYEALMNNRAAQFTNSGLGDKWYALFLEEPKIRMQRPRQVYR